MSQIFSSDSTTDHDKCSEYNISGDDLPVPVQEALKYYFPKINISDFIIPNLYKQNHNTMVMSTQACIMVISSIILAWIIHNIVRYVI